MGQSVVLYPATKQVPQHASLTSNDKLQNQPAGVTVIAVADDFSWAGKKIDWAAKTIVDDLVAIEAELIAKVKSASATLKMGALSPGTAKTEEYRLKAIDIAASANVLASVLNALTVAQGLAQYPTAAVEAKLTGEALATVLTRYRTGAANSNAELRRLSAIEAAACRSIKAASTAAAKRAAYAAINWNWQAS